VLRVVFWAILVTQTAVPERNVMDSRLKQEKANFKIKRR
jgi:hypothetical protein